MAATTQAHIDTLQSQVEQDGTLSNAQKAQAQGLLFALARVVLGGNSTSTVNNSTVASGPNNGHSG
jgi:hypothetical protein